ncbi:MAG: hypothetical protein GY720_16095 [bacterium]|nr:hypothetical protein [bacterium]
MRFRRNNKRDKERSEMAAANRIRNLGGRSTYVDVDPEEVNRRLRNLTYGSTDSRISATRPDYEPPQLYRASQG